MDLGLFGQLIGNTGLGTLVDDHGLILILAGLEEQVFIEEFQAYYQQPGYKKYEVGKRPKFGDLFIDQISDPVLFRRFILNAALSDYRHLTLSQRVNYDLVDFAEFDDLTLTEMEQIDAVGESWVVHPGKYPQAEMWTKHPELYQLFVDVAKDPEELKFYLGKIDRLFELGLEERQRSQITLVGTTDKTSPEYQTKLDEHRKKTKEELFDEIRDILTRRGVNVTHGVPPYLWELSRIRVLREIQTYMDSGHRWSERLLLEDFFVSIRGGSTSTPPFGWMSEDFHHCDWEGVTCGVTNRRSVHPRCLELCNEEGCPVGIFEATEERYNRTRTYKIYCPKSRIDPPLDGVTAIELTNKNLQGTLSPHLYQLKWLHKLHLFDNKIEGTLPDSYGAFHSLQSMDLENNKLNGTISWSLSQLRDTLRELWLGGNQLEGALLPDLRELHLLEYFGVAGNQLTGPIPLYEDMVILLSFVANDNAFTGKLFPYWSQNIELLNVANNQLTGEFSDKFSALDNLLEINLENNHLSGPIYVQPLAQLHRLVALKLGNNDLSKNTGTGCKISNSSKFRIINLLGIGPFISSTRMAKASTCGILIYQEIILQGRYLHQLKPCELLRTSILRTIKALVILITLETSATSSNSTLLETNSPVRYLSLCVEKRIETNGATCGYNAIPLLARLEPFTLMARRIIEGVV